MNGYNKEPRFHPAKRCSKKSDVTMISSHVNDHLSAFDRDSKLMFQLRPVQLIYGKKCPE